MPLPGKSRTAGIIEQGERAIIPDRASQVNRTYGVRKASGTSREIKRGYSQGCLTR